MVTLTGLRTPSRSKTIADRRNVVQNPNGPKTPFRAVGSRRARASTRAQGSPAITSTRAQGSPAIEIIDIHKDVLSIDIYQDVESTTSRLTASRFSRPSPTSGGCRLMAAPMMIADYSVKQGTT